jgi:hypothetical protein
MYLFQVEWKDTTLSGFQQNTLFRSFLYNLKAEQHYHLFSSVDNMLFTYVMTDVDLTKSRALNMKFSLLRETDAVVSRLLVLGELKDPKRVEALYQESGSVDRHSFSAKDLKKTSVCSIQTNFNGSHRPVRLELDIKSFSKLVRVSSSDVLLSVSPNVSIRGLAKHLKFKNWVVYV